MNSKPYTQWPTRVVTIYSVPTRREYPITRDKDKYLLLDYRFKDMTHIEILDINTVRILSHAFPNDAFKIITIIAEKNNFSIIGMDHTSSIGVQIKLDISELNKYVFDYPVRFPVFTEDFNAYLSHSISTYIPQEIPSHMPLRLDIQKTQIVAAVRSQDTWSHQRIFSLVPEGIESLPQLTSLENEPNCVVENMGLLKLCSSIFREKKYEKILLEMDSKNLTFKSPDEEQIFKIGVIGNGVSSTSLLTYTFDKITKVLGLKEIENLKITISDKGVTQFFYTFETGVLWYISAYAY
jgi:hypothetical protein